MSPNSGTNAAIQSAISIDQREAARLTGLSAKTLERRAKDGEPVGRIKIGRRVVFHLPTLETWLRSRLVQASKQEQTQNRENVSQYQSGED